MEYKKSLQLKKKTYNKRFKKEYNNSNFLNNNNNKFFKNNKNKFFKNNNNKKFFNSYVPKKNNFFKKKKINKKTCYYLIKKKIKKEILSKKNILNKNFPYIFKLSGRNYNIQLLTSYYKYSFFEENAINKFLNLSSNIFSDIKFLYSIKNSNIFFNIRKKKKLKKKKFSLIKKLYLKKLRYFL
jgi:hypothetical protein